MKLGRLSCCEWEKKRQMHNYLKVVIKRLSLRQTWTSIIIYDLWGGTAIYPFQSRMLVSLCSGLFSVMVVVLIEIDICCFGEI